MQHYDRPSTSLRAVHSQEKPFYIGITATHIKHKNVADRCTIN